MNRTTAMSSAMTSAMSATMNPMVASAPKARAAAARVPASKSLVQRFADWLAKEQSSATETEHRRLLDLAVDHSDLEWRIQELDRRWSHSGGIGGSRA